MPRNIIFILIAVVVYWALKWFCGKRGGTIHEMPNSAFMTMAVALALGLMFGTPRWGTKRPGSFFERSDYQGMFYVHLYPNRQEIQSYRVPASVSSRVETDEDPDDRSYSWREYRINFAVMPNGEEITFESGEALQLNSIVTMYDDRHQYWGVELTDQFVSNEAQRP
jgi:hypothetical protein